MPTGEASAPTAAVRLRETTPGDVDIFFRQQLDPDAIWMAAFTGKDPADRAAFAARWARILGDETMVKRTVIYEGQVAGHVASFERDGEPEITYWLGREFWGKGIATLALAGFLREHTQRPLHARVAKDNKGSLRVLEKCGFRVTGEDRGFANARGEEIEEYVLTLDPVEDSGRS